MTGAERRRGPSRRCRTRAPALVALLGALALGRPAPGAAQQADSLGPGPDDLSVYLLTMGPGDAIWEKFGHNALRIVDRRAVTDVAWNWGMFSFEDEGFILRLIRGTMLYWMGGYPTGATLEAYRQADRAVWMQELALSPAQEVELQRAIHRHALPGNRQYRYDYYRDNCSTRVRDQIDLAVGGALRSALEGEPTGTTYRWHTRRLLGASPFAYLGIQFVLGNPGDTPIDRWEETFLPLRLREYVRDVEVVDEAGERVPLVRREVQVLDSSRPPEPTEPPERLWGFLAVGLVWGALVAFTGTRAAHGGWGARLVFVTVAGAWAAASGVAGTILGLAWPLTDHVFWAWNENLLQASPLALLVSFGLLVVAVRGRAPRWTVLLGLWVGGLSLLGFLVQPLPGLDQVNGEIIALALPPNLALAWALLVQRGGSAGAPGATAAGRARSDPRAA